MNMLENTWHPNKTPFNKMVYTLGKGNTRIAISNLTVIDSIAKKIKKYRPVYWNQTNKAMAIRNNNTCLITMTEVEAVIKNFFKSLQHRWFIGDYHLKNEQWFQIATK